MYSSELLDHFERPRNSGELDNPDARVRIENPACGDILELSVRTRKGVIREIRFRAKGCVPAMACGSLVTELATGKTVEEAMDIGREDVVRAIGGLPEASGHAAQLAIDGLRVLLWKITHG
jgi:nitrogen fixation protein NifU and related proteins